MFLLELKLLVVVFGFLSLLSYGHGTFDTHTEKEPVNEITPTALNLLGTVKTIELSHPNEYAYVPPKDIPIGCARLYISDPIGVPNGTRWWQLCTSPQKDTPQSFEVGQGILEALSHEGYGIHTANSISFISTGQDAWVDVYAESGLRGSHYEITPLRDVDLSLVTNTDNPDELSFNDNVISGTLRSTTESFESPETLLKEPNVAPIASWYSFSNVPRINITSSGCGYFYDRIPTSASDLLQGFALCLSHDHHLAHMNIKDMTNRGLILLKNESVANLHAIKPWTGDAAHLEEHKRKYLRSSVTFEAPPMPDTFYGVRRKLGENRDQEDPSASFSYYNTTGELTENIINGTQKFFTSFYDGISVILTDIEWAFEEYVEKPVFDFLGEDSSENSTSPDYTAEKEDPTPPSNRSATSISHVRLPPSVNQVDLSGIKYVEAGKDLDIALWTEDNFRGNQTILKANHAAITDQYVVNSIFLISHVYVRNIPSTSQAISQPNLKQREKLYKAANLARKQDDVKHVSA